ncbi:MAG: hypothetical protein ABI879_06725 [Actinomycetota bacterium]
MRAGFVSEVPLEVVPSDEPPVEEESAFFASDPEPEPAFDSEPDELDPESEDAEVLDFERLSVA